jgi:hypothetical protein
MKKKIKIGWYDIKKKKVIGDIKWFIVNPKLILNKTSNKSRLYLVVFQDGIKIIMSRFL